MKFPTISLPSLPSLPTVLSPLKALPALKMNLADLTKASRNWASVLPGAAEAAGPGALEEVASFGANPGALRMFRFVPQGLPAGAALVVVLHGCMQTAAGYDKGAGWSTLATRHGFALLFPEQQRANNAHTCFNWFEPGDVARERGEAASIRGMVATMMADLRIDPGRVFVTGLSAGGAMAAALLATYPDVFAAGAVIAGLPYGSASSAQEAFGAMYHPAAKPAADRGAAVRAPSVASRRWPAVAIWQGDADTTVAPANAAELAKQWCDVHGLHEHDAVVDVVNGAAHRIWRDAGGMAQVELYMVPGMGHGAPIDPVGAGDRGVGTPMPYMLDGGVSSTWHIAQSWGLLTK